MYEKQFLKDVAIQNYTKYNINVTEWLDKIPYNLSGKMFTVYRNYSDRSIKTSISIFNYWFQENLFEENTIIHLPVVDDLSKGKYLLVYILFYVRIRVHFILWQWTHNIISIYIYTVISILYLSPVRSSVLHIRNNKSAKKYTFSTYVCKFIDL